MSLPLFLHAIGSVGVFASRAFLPAFATAMLLRFGPDVPWLGQAGLMPQVRDVPTWFTSDVSLVVLGVLAILELVAERVPEVQDVLEQVHDFLKAGMAGLTMAGVIGATDRAVALQVINAMPFGDYLPLVGMAAVGTLIVSGFRFALLRPLREADEDDDLGLWQLTRWVEDLWGLLGPVALIALPLLTLAALGLALVPLAWFGYRAEARAEAARVACSNCGNLMHASATICPSCRAPHKEARAVGTFGGALDRPADPARHAFRLAAVKRCPACAERLPLRQVAQDCPACGSGLMADPGFVRDYVAAIDRRVPAVVVGCFAFGLVPVLGVIPGVILFRLGLVAPFRRYIPAGRAMALRWVARALVVGLVALQWVPGAGAFALPAVALIQYGTYRTAFRRMAPA